MSPTIVRRNSKPHSDRGSKTRSVRAAPPSTAFAPIDTLSKILERQRCRQREKIRMQVRAGRNRHLHSGRLIDCTRRAKPPVQRSTANTWPATEQSLEAIDSSLSLRHVAAPTDHRPAAAMHMGLLSRSFNPNQKLRQSVHRLPRCGHELPHFTRSSQSLEPDM